MVLNSLLFKEVWKNETRGHGRIFAGAKRKQQKYVRQLQCQEQRVLIISHITFRDCRVYIIPGNLSRHSCITIKRIHSRGQHLCNFMATKEICAQEKSPSPSGFVWNNNLAAISLFLSLLINFYFTLFHFLLYWLFWYWNLHVEDKVIKIVVVLFWNTKMAVVTTCEYA